MGKETKELVNKLEGKIFSDSEKHKTMFDRMS